MARSGYVEGRPRLPPDALIRLLATAAAAAAALTTVASASGSGWRTVTVRRHAGPVSAVLSVERRPLSYGGFDYRNLRLVVRNGSRTVLSRGLCTSERCGPGSQHTLKLADVWGSSLREVLVDLYTGGAHCCFQTLVVLVDGAHAGRVLFHDWGDPGYRLQRHDGGVDFVTADDGFAYLFTSFADSGLPVQVWKIDAAGRFVDITSSRLDLVRADARQWWRAYVGERGKPDADVRGVLAAWCADEYRLARESACTAELSRALGAGYLDGPSGWPRNAAYVAALKKHLAAWGYRAHGAAA